jgi:hypothetical protein
MKVPQKFISGLVGALALTASHEILRKTQPNAPRMDQLGKQSLIKIANNLNLSLTRKPSTLHNITLAGDVLGNALYYSIITRSSGKQIWNRSVLLGLLAGIGAIVLPKPLGLNPQASNRSTKTRWLTLALYLEGALVTGFTYQKLTTTK